MAEFHSKGEYIDSRMEEDGFNPNFAGKRVSEWTEARRKLNFEKPFSGGILQATEDENGVASFKVLDLDGKKIIMDFQDLAPNFTFVTPTYWLNQKQKSRGDWGCDYKNKLILIGEFSERGVLALLHEISHSKLDEAMWYSKLKESSEGLDVKNEAKIKSELERAVWADALKTVRQISEKKGINLLEGFSKLDDKSKLDQAELWKYIYSSLSSHRYSAELKDIGTLRLLLIYIFGGKVVKLLKIDGTDFKWLDKLFDKRERKLIK